MPIIKGSFCIIYWSDAFDTWIMQMSALCFLMWKNDLARSIFFIIESVVERICNVLVSFRILVLTDFSTYFREHSICLGIFIVYAHGFHEVVICISKIAHFAVYVGSELKGIAWVCTGCNCGRRIFERLIVVSGFKFDFGSQFERVNIFRCKAYGLFRFARAERLSPYLCLHSTESR